MTAFSPTPILDGRVKIGVLNSVLDVANVVGERPVGVAMNTGDVDDDTA